MPIYAKGADICFHPTLEQEVSEWEAEPVENIEAMRENRFELTDAYELVQFRKIGPRQYLTSPPVQTLKIEVGLWEKGYGWRKADMILRANEGLRIGDLQDAEVRTLEGWKIHMGAQISLGFAWEIATPE